MEQKLLEVGDVVYRMHRLNGWQKYIINRVTAKRAYTGALEMHREITECEYMGLRVKSVADYSDYYPENPIIAAKYEHQDKVNKALDLLHSNKLTKQSITIEMADKIIAFFESLNQPTQP